MILSHSKKFIFLKSRKTAGTSLETALSNYCRGEDVVTPLGDYEFNKDDTGTWRHMTMNAVGYEQHDNAATIYGKVGPKVWESYLKFSVTRNPWDRVVSLFTWRTRQQRKLTTAGNTNSDSQETFRRERESFRRYVSSTWETNDAFYFMNDRFFVDLILRYEHLQEDIGELCSRIAIPAIELPRLKSGFRSDEHHYSDYYDEVSKSIVADRHKNDIRQFGYRFETT